MAAAGLANLVRGFGAVDAGLRFAAVEPAMAERLPHHKLVAFEVATELLQVVAESKIADTRLRDQALRAAKSVCLNIAEAAGRTSRADQARVFTIARGEACEAAAAVEIASIANDCTREFSTRANQVTFRLVGLLTGLIRSTPNQKAHPLPPKPDD